MGYSTELRNAKLDANSTIIGNAGKIKFFAGTKPATGGAEGTLLASGTLGTPFAPPASAGTQSPTLPSNMTSVADGTVTWARITKSNNTTPVMDLTVGLAGSGSQIIVSTATVISGKIFSVQSWTITEGNP